MHCRERRLVCGAWRLDGRQPRALRNRLRAHRLEGFLNATRLRAERTQPPRLQLACALDERGQLDRPAFERRPLGFGRLPNEAKSASFAVPSGLLVYPQYAHLEHVEPRHTRQLKTGTDGYFGKVGRWLREGF